MANITKSKHCYVIIINYRIVEKCVCIQLFLSVQTGTFMQTIFRAKVFLVLCRILDSAKKKNLNSWKIKYNKTF